MGIDEMQEGHRRVHLEDMEREIYVDRLTLKYEGPFSYKDFMKLVDSWCEEKGYYKDVQSTKQKVTEDSKSISLGIQLQKAMTDRHFSIINVDIGFSGMTDYETKVDGRDAIINKGEVEIVFHGFLMTSLKARWETKDYAAFIKGFIDKFVYKLLKPKYSGTVIEDGNDLANRMNGFLQSYRARIGEKKEKEETP
jgi:hypothetical protein